VVRPHNSQQPILSFQGKMKRGGKLPNQSHARFIPRGGGGVWEKEKRQKLLVQQNLEKEKFRCEGKTFLFNL
jgi:hypothetical protein